MRHEVGAVLLVDFEPGETAGGVSLECEALVVECEPCPCGHGFGITLLFTGN